MKRNKLEIFSVIFCAASVALTLGTETVFASDDFNRIVHHIEVNYHVHRNHRWVMGFAGLVVKVSHIAGVKSFKGAIFEDQQLEGTAADQKLDEIVLRAGESGWQPMVKSYSRRTGEHAFIYAKPEGKDLKLLIVSVEPSEAAVIQVKINPDKLNDFLEEHGGVARHPTSDLGAMSFR
jgi:hypothetical protein